MTSVFGVMSKWHRLMMMMMMIFDDVILTIVGMMGR